MSRGSEIKLIRQDYETVSQSQLYLCLINIENISKFGSFQLRDELVHAWHNLFEEVKCSVVHNGRFTTFIILKNIFYSLEEFSIASDIFKEKY